MSTVIVRCSCMARPVSWIAVSIHWFAAGCLPNAFAMIAINRTTLRLHQRWPNNSLEDEMYHYLKHSFFVVTIPIVAILVVVAPDWAFVAPLAIAAFHILIDIGTPRETSVPSYRMPGALDAYLYLHVMVSLLSLGALLWVAAPGDLWGVGQWLDRRFNLDLVGTSDHASWSA